MKAIICLVLLSFIVGSAFSAATSASFTAATFNTAPVKVFDSTNTTDKTAFAPATSGAISTYVFGAGLTNDTIYVYAVQYMSNSLSGVIRRTLNATQAAIATDTTESPVPTSSDTTIAIGPVTLVQPPVTATGNGSFAIAGVVAGNLKLNSVDNLYFYTLAGGALSQTYTIAAAAATAQTSTSTVPTLSIGNIWFEAGNFYIIYELQSIACSNVIDASTACTKSSTKTTDIQIQGFAATSKNTLYTTPISVATGLTLSGTTNYYILQTNARGANSNYTNSTLIQAQYKDAVAGKLYYGTYTKSTGAVASAAAVVGTDATWVSTTTDGLVFAVGGFIASNGSYGGVFANGTAPKSQAAATPINYAGLAALNGTTAVASQINLGVATQTNGQIYVTGYPYQAGFGVIVNAPATTGNSYSWMTYYANGTMNSTTSAAIGTFGSQVSQFVDVQGGLWVGSFSTDTSGNPLTGYIGRLVANITYSNTTTTAKSANVLATFAAILSFVIASLFMF